MEDGDKGDKGGREAGKMEAGKQAVQRKMETVVVVLLTFHVSHFTKKRALQQ
jgi:hypothetical protein